jgi:hypothetical protein
MVWRQLCNSGNPSLPKRQGCLVRPDANQMTTERLRTLPVMRLLFARRRWVVVTHDRQRICSASKNRGLCYTDCTLINRVSWWYNFDRFLHRAHLWVPPKADGIVYTALKMTGSINLMFSRKTRLFCSCHYGAVSLKYFSTFISVLLETSSCNSSKYGFRK